MKVQVLPKSFIAAAIPAFNEEKTIGRIVLLAKRHADVVVVCDDGSTDMTAEIAERLGATVLRHPRNMGKGAALRTALEYLKQQNPDVVVTMDADGQHDLRRYRGFCVEFDRKSSWRKYEMWPCRSQEVKSILPKVEASLERDPLTFTHWMRGELDG
jgi:glycosyltransferase involved in cell wall biosynthesis